MSYHIVILDAVYTNPGDLSWKPLDELGKVTIYQQTLPDQIIPRSKDADILVINKVTVGAQELEQLPKLKMIAISATGTDNVDLGAAHQRNIVVKNAEGYSTDSVAQHTFSLLLSLTNKVARHHSSVKKREWDQDKGFSYFLDTIPQLSGKKMGIYGFGKIGRKVAKIADALGMKIYLTSNHAREEDHPFYRIVDLKTLFSECDFISLHSPLTRENRGIVNASLLTLMKNDAFLINTSRGGLINEQDLCYTLENNAISGAALDVLCQEPPSPKNPLLDLDNCIITPHMAWVTKEARRKLIEMVTENIRSFKEPTLTK